VKLLTYLLSCQPYTKPTLILKHVGPGGQVYTLADLPPFLYLCVLCYGGRRGLAVRVLTWTTCAELVRHTHPQPEVGVGREDGASGPVPPN